MSKTEVSLEELLYMDSEEYKASEYIRQEYRAWSKNPLKEKYSKLLGHLDLVQDNCRKLAMALIDDGNEKLAHELIIEGQVHDLSKLYNLEWEYLCDYDKYKDSPLLKEAINQHVKNNNHHPEFWAYKNGIHSMDDISLASLVCDWESRGQEFGKPVRQFMEEQAFKKYNFNESSAVFQRMNYFYKLLTGENI